MPQHPVFYRIWTQHFESEPVDWQEFVCPTFWLTVVACLNYLNPEHVDRNSDSKHLSKYFESPGVYCWNFEQKFHLSVFQSLSDVDFAYG